MRILHFHRLPRIANHMHIELENFDDRLLRIREVLNGLPQPNFDLLKRVSEHLDK